jgi:hypothetical protein
MQRVITQLGKVLVVVEEHAVHATGRYQSTIRTSWSLLLEAS